MPINTTNQIMPSQKTILIVEDEFAVANDLRQILEKAGYRVSGIAFTVAKAIEIKNQQKPDLVLLDILLKGEQTGIDLARILGEENIPFIYVSANTNSSILEEVKTTQPYGFIVKPFREKDVLIALEIAHYRHAHRIEVRVRKEQALQIALTDAFSGNEPWEDRLLKVTSLFQKHIPFDYFIIGFEKNHLVDAYRSCSFFRIGKEEYQTIWIENFLQMTGLTLKKYQEIQEQIPEMTEAIYNGAAFEELCRRNPIKQLISKTFNMESNLIIPLKTATNGTFFLSFFSRQPSTYLKEHLYILERLRPSLALTVDRLMAFDQIKKLSEQLDQENKYLLEEVKTGANFEEMIGESSALVNVFKSISQVAPTDYTVLILGETGTGKELIARAVHNRSFRKGKALIKVNCAALPPQLIESELFGHEKGSFTGATEKRIGKFELAHGGTIFLDEIGELPIELQPKLLRVLQEREIERVGGKGPIPVDVRIIAATNRNLQDEIAAGRFRSDLYYRLNVFPVKLPPLRERNEDLMPLAMHFMKKISKKLGKSLTGISESSKLQMLSYHWPGNIRELEHLLERAAIMATSPIISLVEPLLSEPSSDHELTTSENSSMPIVKPQIKAEKDNILKALNIANFRIRGKGGAAELLDIKPTTLEAKMARLGIYRNR
ncbi:sigma 54-interacting transcriptional regulator [Algoriphagus sp. NG3]|uniref:sigma 54-interacting transcriptional regulator n=1 Tax=Algoriphagus sp. NG3 TaxID=3097546 RepID=UPI002A827F04|nr:sigma 54-interacting transcriptional regulator [Algoriphagus sp. NG3]WPR77322.1 sigma 54-interacting transcriptional regulator [Algoriphagus sp. NG3]